jgi:hypothetical protein
MVVLNQAPGASLASSANARLRPSKHLGPVGKRALAVLASAMEDRSVPEVAAARYCIGELAQDASGVVQGRRRLSEARNSSPIGRHRSG